jgi:hypothetical protein
MMGHGFYGLVALTFSRTVFGDLSCQNHGLLYKAILHPSLVECLYRSFFLLGAELDARGFNNRLCRLPIDRRPPACSND